MNANTLPPGMTNADYMARRGAALPRGVGQAHPLFASKALNAELWDVEGRRYIDFVAGIAVVNTGHCHPKVVAAAQAQIPHFSHTCFQVVAYDGYLRLAERLNKLAPGDAPKKTFFVSTGAEAVENAVKIARGYTGRPGVIAFTGAFHGRTLLTLGLTGKVDPYKLGVGPFPAEIYHAPYPCALHGVSVDDAMRGIETLFKNDIEAKRVAAFIVEPVQGEGGYYPAPAEFLQRLRALADKHGIVLIADEIQTGVGRTGKMFAMEHSGVVPDLRVNFELNSFALTPDSKATLDELAKAMQMDQLSSLRFVIGGYTDASGSAGYNERLSEKRAASVVDYLKSKGVDRGRLEPIGHGEKDLADPANPESGVNRRVEVRTGR